MYTGPGCRKANSAHVKNPLDVKNVYKNVNMFNHCIFCLRKISANQETITVVNKSNCSASTAALTKVPCASPEYSTSASAPLLFALNKIWSHLQKGGDWDWDDDEGYSGQQRFTQFTCFPTICYYCAADFSSICKLMSQLKEEINKLGVIIRESKKGGAYSWRAESFERTLKDSAVERQCISDTLQFLGISYENQSSSLLPASLGSRTFGVTMETEIPSVITETFLSEQPKEEETSPGHFDFHDEGSEDDASIEYDDTDNDPNYVKEEEDAFSNSEDSESARQDFDEDFPTPKSNRMNCTISRRSRSKRDWLEEINIQQHRDHCTIEHLDDETLGDSKSESDHSLTSCPNFVETNSADSTMMLANSTSNVQIKIHQQKHDSSTEQELLFGQQQQPNNICNISGKTIPTPANLGQHIIMVHGNNTQQQANKIVCSICGKTMKTLKCLRQHIKNVHINAKVVTFTCDLCKIQVPKKDYYDHVRAHVGEEYLIRCPNPNIGQCSFVCCTHRGLQFHLRSRICRTATPDVNEKYLKPRDAFICQVCGEDRGNLRSLRSHLNEWHEKEGTKEFPCPIQGCPHRFSWRQSVVLHIPSHINKLKSFDCQPCDVCKEKIKCEEMEKHLKETHHLSEESIIKCFQCPFLFSDRTNLVDHLYEHRDIALFCDICGNPDTTFQKHNDLRRHYFEVHQIGSKFLCEHCQSEYFSASGIKRHVEKRHPAIVAPEEKPSKEPSGGCSSSSAVACSDALIEEKLFKCDECDVAYKSKQSLTLHKSTIHQGKLLPCKFCDQKFTSIGRKYAHEKKHRRGPGDHMKEKFPCQVPGCGKQFSAKETLKRHTVWVHQGKQSNVCDQCGKAFSSSSVLKTHVQTIHMGERNHVCDVCGKSFSSVTVLKRHKLIHTGDRPFACQLCGQKFRHKEVLKRHIEAHKQKGADFKPNGPMKQVRKRAIAQSKRKKAE